MSRPEATLDIEPPNDLHAERALLGALMLAHDAHLVEVDPADFHRESHRRLLEAIVEAGSSGPVDAIAVGGIVPDLRLLITECQSEVDLVCSAPGHAKTVSEMARRRRIRRAAQEMIAGIDGGRETEDVEADALALFTRSRPMDAAVSLQEMVRGEIEALSRPQECVYIEGFPGIAIYGGDSAVVGGRPGHGKSAFGFVQALEWSASRKVAFYSYEMSASQIGRRAISRFSGLSLTDMNRGLDDCDSRIVTGLIGDQMKGRDLTFVAAAGWTPRQLFASMRTFAAGGGQAVVIDYVQLAARARAGTLREDVTVFSNDLKQVLLQTGLIGLVLSQLRRPADERALQPPLASELRESGSLEQDADTIFLLMQLPPLRSEPRALPLAEHALKDRQMRVEDLAVGDDPGDDRRLVLIEAAKVRQGRCDKVPFVFDGAAMTFDVVPRTREATSR